jgi:peptidoglycan-N-acetylglucosamine deacetylase
MLNFRNTNIVFAIVVFALISLDLQSKTIQGWLFGLLLFFYMLILFLGSYFIQSDFYLKTFCKAKSKDKIISLSFDDGPQEQYTRDVLSILKEHNVPATFFCIGENITNNPDLLKKIHNDGHIIGNHSYTHHTWFDLFSKNHIQDELQQTNDVVRQLLDIQLKWFRPPYGVTNPLLSRVVKNMGFITIGWSIRSYDTMAKDSVLLLNKMKRLLKPGAIILFHDKCLSTVTMLPMFLQYVKDEGYEIVPMDKLLHLNPYA